MFMYLHLRSDANGNVQAAVKNHGALTFDSLGGPHSRSSAGTFCVIAINDFDGIEHLTDEVILAEVHRRFTSKEIFQRSSLRFTNEELLELLEERLKRPK